MTHEPTPRSGGHDSHRRHLFAEALTMPLYVAISLRAAVLTAVTTTDGHVSLPLLWGIAVKNALAGH